MKRYGDLPATICRAQLLSHFLKIELQNSVPKVRFLPSLVGIRNKAIVPLGHLRQLNPFSVGGNVIFVPPRGAV